MLGVPDAYELPAQPGNGYLKVDTTGMTRFKAAYVSGPATRTTATPARGQQRMRPVIAGSARLRGAAYAGTRPSAAGPGARAGSSQREAAESLLDVVVAQLAGQGAAGPPDLAAAAGPAAVAGPSCCRRSPSRHAG